MMFSAESVLGSSGNRRHLDEEVGISKARLDGRAGRRVVFCDPSVPSFVHGGEPRHVGEVDGDADQVVLGDAGLRQRVIEAEQNFLGLHLDGSSARLFGDMAREEDQISDDDCIAPAFRHSNSFNHRVNSTQPDFGRFPGVGSPALIASMTHIAATPYRR